jgi:HAMP domain-containing protein
MSLRIKMILITTAVVTVLFGVSEWLNYQHTAALLDEHEAILIETADHNVALQKLQATRDKMFLSVTAVRVMHAVLTLLLAVAALNYIWYRIFYRPIQTLLVHINSMGRGTWHASIPVKRRDEIGELTVAFNELGQQLTSTFQHINSASKLSALALTGGRFVRSITSVRSDIAAAFKCFDRGTDAGRSAGMEIIAGAQAQLDALEERFQKEFEQEFSATLQGDGAVSRLNAPAHIPERTTATH